MDDLIANTPADGMVTGIGTVNAGAVRRREVALRRAWPTTTRCWPAPRACATTRRWTACWPRAPARSCRWCCSPRAAAAGPATSTCPSSPACTTHTFSQFAALSGKVPVVGIVHGRCFAGNAALLGCCDVIIATEHEQHRHGRPGDDRGRRPRALSARGDRPSDVQSRNGVIDILVEDEAEAVAAARHYLSLLPGPPRALGVRRPARAAPRRAREPAARLRRFARSSRRPGRHRLAARAARRLRRRHRHRARPHRRAGRSA